MQLRAILKLSCLRQVSVSAVGFGMQCQVAEHASWQQLGHHRETRQVWSARLLHTHNFLCKRINGKAKLEKAFKDVVSVGIMASTVHKQLCCCPIYYEKLIIKYHGMPLAM